MVMSRHSEIIGARVKGPVVPISIATALAIESVIGLNENAPTDDPQIEHIEVMLVNVRTMVRNLLGAIESEIKYDIPYTELEPIIIAEMGIIEAIINEYSSDRVKTIFYYPSYGRILIGKYKYGILKVPNKPKQIYGHQAEIKIGEALIKDADKITQHIVETNSELPKLDAKTLVLTHYPVDLLSRYNFTELRLLESHTGAIKGVSLWNTKLQNGRELTTIPFDQAMLQAFGDGVMFRPAAIGLRREILKVSQKYNWTPLSTQQLIKHSVKQHKDPFLIEYIDGCYK